MVHKAGETPSHYIQKQDETAHKQNAFKAPRGILSLPQFKAANANTRKEIEEEQKITKRHVEQLSPVNSPTATTKADKLKQAMTSQGETLRNLSELDTFETQRVQRKSPSSPSPLKKSIKPSKHLPDAL